MSVTLGMILSGNVDDDDDGSQNNRRYGESSMMMPVLDQPRMAQQHQRPNHKYKYIVAQDPPTNQKEDKDDGHIRPSLIQRQEQRRQDRVEDFYRQHPLLQAYRRPRRQRQPTPEGEDCGNFHIHCPPDRIPRDSPAASGRLVIHDVTQMEDDHDDDDDSFSQTSSSNSSLSSDSHKQQNQPALANVELPSLPPLNAEKTVQDCQVVGKQATSMLLGRQHQYHPSSRRPSSGETTKQHPDYTVPSKHFESPTSAVHFPDLLAPANEVQTSSSPIPARRRQPRIQRPHGAAAAALADRLSSLSTTNPVSKGVETKDTRPRQESFTLQAELPQTKSQQERVVVMPAKSTEQNANSWWTTTTAACFSCTTSPSQTSPIIKTPPKPKQVTTTFLAPVALPAAMALTTTSPVQVTSPLSVIAETKAKQHLPPIPESSSNNNRRAIVPRPRTPARRKTRSSSSKVSKKKKKQQQGEEEMEVAERKSPKDDQPTMHRSAQEQNPMRDQEELVPNGSNNSPFPHFFDLPESDQDLLAHLVPQATVLPPPPPPVTKNETTDFLKLPSLSRSFPNNKEGGGPPYQELRIWSKTESDNDDDNSSSASPLFPIAEVVVPPNKKQGTKHHHAIRTSTSFPVPILRPPPQQQEHRKEQSMPHQRTVSFPLYLQQKDDDPIVRARHRPKEEEGDEDITIPPLLPVRSQRVHVPNSKSRMDQIREVLEEQQTQEELETTPMVVAGNHEPTRNLEYYLSKLSQTPVAAPAVAPSSREDSTVQPIMPASAKAPPLERLHSKKVSPPPPPAPMEKLTPVVEKPALGPIEKNVPSQFHSHTSTTGVCFGCLSHLLVFVFCCGGGGDEQESNVRPRTDTLETVVVENDAPTHDDTGMAATDGGGPQNVSSQLPPPRELLLPVPQQQRQVRQVISNNNNPVTTHINVPSLLQHQEDHDNDDDETCVSSHFASKYEYSLASHPHNPSPRSFERRRRRRQVHFDMQDDDTESKRNAWYDTEVDDDLGSMPSMSDATRAAYMHTVVFGPAPASFKTPDQQEREFVQTLFEPLPEEPFLSRICC